MDIRTTTIPGCHVIETKKIQDNRGYFARAWCSKTLEEHGLCGTIMQSNIAVSLQRGTLRGLHFQLPPHREVKYVRCVRGRIFNVVVDLRANSSTYCKWIGVELSPEDARALYVPEGCANGYVTLADDTEICYHTSAIYSPQHAQGVRFNDPRFSIEWPLRPRSMSEQDKGWPDFSN